MFELYASSLRNFPAVVYINTSFAGKYPAHTYPSPFFHDGFGTIVPLILRLISLVPRRDLLKTVVGQFPLQHHIYAQFPEVGIYAWPLPVEPVQRGRCRDRRIVFGYQDVHSMLQGPVHGLFPQTFPRIFCIRVIHVGSTDHEVSRIPLQFLSAFPKQRIVSCWLLLFPHQLLLTVLLEEGTLFRFSFLYFLLHFNVIWVSRFLVFISPWSFRG